ncbi:MAG: flagellar basal body L-ring protein FlgH [Verrucomicrobiae bacterium]|nr:flagellar basal body L-ring protein FlgH [Verrucomicrobiae bacterium]
MNKPSSLSSRLAALAAAFTLCSALTAGADSLWDEDSSRSMFADKRASAVGDILTIVVQENNAASKEATTKTAKKSGVDASIQQFLYGPAASGLLTKGGQYPALKFSAKNDFEGGGQINNSEKITARIAVRVVDVLPNKNLVVEGRRQTSFSGEVQDVVLRGVIRAEDVTANNTVFSYQVADAQITILSKGSVSNTQKKGWFTRVWDKISPF